MPTKSKTPISDSAHELLVGAVDVPLIDVSGIPQGNVPRDHENAGVPLLSGPGRLPIDDIAPSDFNPREDFDSDGLFELAASIKEHGLLEPIVVRPVEPRRHTAASSTQGSDPAGAWSVFRRHAGTSVRVRVISGPAARAEAEDLARRMSRALYQIIAGERRWWACRGAGLDMIDVTVRDVDDQKAAVLAVVENLQRKGVNAFEEARGFRTLVDSGMPHAEIARVVGCSPSRISKRLALDKLPREIQELIKTKQLDASHGDRLQSYSSFPKVQIALAQAAAANSWPVKKLELTVIEDDMIAPMKTAKAVRDLDYNVEFDWKVVCRDGCPFKAFREARFGRGVCLNPSHLQILNREYKQEKLDKAAQAADSAIEARTASGTTARVRDLKCLVLLSPGDDSPEDGRPVYWDGSYRFTPAPGCTSECACRGFALDGDGKKVLVCLDEQRFMGLGAAAAESRREEKRKKLAIRAELASDALIAAASSMAASYLSEFDHPILNYLLREDAESYITRSHQIGAKLDMIRFAAEVGIVLDSERDFKEARYSTSYFTLHESSAVRIPLVALHIIVAQMRIVEETRNALQYNHAPTITDGVLDGFRNPEDGGE